jgi:hypothetical protein
MDILLLLCLLQTKHFYADFVRQTYAQTVHKGVYGNWVGITHSLDHIWSTIIALLIYNFFCPISLIFILVIALVEGIIHYHIDWTKVKFGNKDITKPLFWTQFGIDQLAHQLTYVIMAWAICVK